MMFDMVLSVAQRAVVNMIRTRGGSIRMIVNESALGVAGVTGINSLKNLGLITVIPLVNTSGESDIRLTPLGVKVAAKIAEAVGGES